MDDKSSINERDIFIWLTVGAALAGLVIMLFID